MATSERLSGIVVTHHPYETLLTDTAEVTKNESDMTERVRP